MTDNEILKKAIEKAVKNGFDYEKFYGMRLNHAFSINNEFNHRYIESISTVIFSHEFAKAYWGEEITEKENEFLYWTFSKEYERGSQNKLYPEFRWQLHLQMMVLSPEPLKYIERFLC